MKDPKVTRVSTPDLSPVVSVVSLAVEDASNKFLRKFVLFQGTRLDPEEGGVL